MQLANSLYELRRTRDAAVGRKGLFGEPGWDILLDLYIAECRNTEIQVSSVCLDCGVPSTTVLRWITRLEREGLIFRKADNTDGRRRHVRLTDDGRAMMQSVLMAMSSRSIS